MWRWTYVFVTIFLFTSLSHFSPFFSSLIKIRRFVGGAPSMLCYYFYFPSSKTGWFERPGFMGSDRQVHKRARRLDRRRIEKVYRSYALDLGSL